MPLLEGLHVRVEQRKVVLLLYITNDRMDSNIMLVRFLASNSFRLLAVPLANVSYIDS